jgi:hypothetical protein
MDLTNKSNKELSERILLLKDLHGKLTNKTIELIDNIDNIEKEYTLINNELIKRNKK